jgi:hypothetical protein
MLGSSGLRSRQRYPAAINDKVLDKTVYYLTWSGELVVSLCALS